MTETFYLVDGHSQIMRAYWAPMEQNLTSPAGEPTKATFVFCRILLNVLEREKPDYLAIAMDPPAGPTRRLELHPEYKAQRERAPEDLLPQIARIEQILAAAGIPAIRFAGEEADDVMATIVHTLRDRDLRVVLVSRDKDLFQLLGPRVSLFDPQKGEFIDADGLERDKGFRPEQAVEVQTLMGDAVDNIPGVPKVGLKTAASLIERYGTADGVVAHADELTPKLRQNVLAFAPKVELTRRLVTLRRDCPISFDLESARTSRFTLERLAPIFLDLGFTRLRAAVDAEAEAPPAAPHRMEVADSLALETAVDPPALAALAERLRRAGSFAVDTETTSLRPRDAELVGISFAWEERGGTYVPLRSTRAETAPIEAVRAHLFPLLADPALKKSGQNLKYDLQVLRRAGVELDGLEFDTMVASYLLDPERQSHALDSLAREFLGYEPIPISDVLGRSPDQISMDAADPALLARYAAEDSNVAFRLRLRMEPELAGRGLTALFSEVEMPLVRVLADMEWHGVKLDTDLLAEISREFEAKLELLRERIWKGAGRAFNVDSPKQLGEVLFDELGLPVIKRTKTGRSTDAEVLGMLASTSAHPLPGLVLSYRELAKLKNTYVDALPQLVSPSTGRLHPSYHQTVAATGRLSASEPNIQNIPIRTEEGRRVRQAFVAEAGDSVLLTADYSQIELRILAHFSGDPALTRAFEEGEDIHRWVAGQVWGMPPAEVPRSLRDQAKAVNFGIIYGQTAFGLARTLGIPRGEASRFIDAYKRKFVGIAGFVERTVEEARQTGYVQTLLGRRRALGDISSRNRARRQQAERFAVNTMIQGSAADLIKAAMVRLHALLAGRSCPARMIIQVHDELVFEVPAGDAPELARLVEKAMTSALSVSVPLKVDTAWGRSWLEGKGG